MRGTESHAWPPVPTATDREIVRLSQDIEGILDGWEYEPDGLQVRIITGDDGTEQDPDADRPGIDPDGTGRAAGRSAPDGFPSLLDAYEAKAKAALAERYALFAQLRGLRAVDARGNAVLPSLPLGVSSRDDTTSWSETPIGTSGYSRS